MRIHGLVAMASALHAEGPQFNPGWMYVSVACAAKKGSDMMTIADHNRKGAMEDCTVSKMVHS